VYIESGDTWAARIEVANRRILTFSHCYFHYTCPHTTLLADTLGITHSTVFHFLP
jgi:hypothetical protein